MSTGTALMLLGFGIGTLYVVSQTKLSSSRGATSLRERTIEAQRAADLAAQHARRLAEQLSATKEHS